MLHLIFVTLPPKSKITPIFTPCQKQHSSSNPNLWAPKLTSFRGTPCHIFYHHARWLKSPKLEVNFMQLASTALLVLLHWLVESSKYKNDVLSASRCFLFLRKSNAVKWCGAAQQSFQNKKGLPHTNLLHHIGQNRPSECTLGDMGCKQFWSSYTLARGDDLQGLLMFILGLHVRCNEGPRPCLRPAWKWSWKEDPWNSKPPSFLEEQNLQDPTWNTSLNPHWTNYPEFFDCLVDDGQVLVISTKPPKDFGEVGCWSWISRGIRGAFWTFTKRYISLGWPPNRGKMKVHKNPLLNM